MRKLVITTLTTVLALGVWTPTANAGSSDRAAPIRIAKVSYDGAGSDSGTNPSLNREWVAIKSFGQRTRQLRGWTLWDASGNVFHFPQFRLRPDTAVTVHTGDGRRTRHDLYWGMDNYVWNDTGDRAILSNRDDRIIDRCRGERLKNC